MAIEFPVNVEEDRFDIWDTDLAQIVNEKPKRWPRADGMPIEGADESLKPLLRVRGTDTPIDEQTQRYGPLEVAVDLVAETCTYTKSILALTQEELDANAEQEAEQAERDQAKALYQDLKDGTGTQAQRIQRCERVLARILKDTYG